MKSYDTIVEAINDLKKTGYSIDLNIAFDKKLCSQSNQYLSPDDFIIVKTYRFEGYTNPSDEEILYAISSKDGKIKGIFTEAYGTYADNTAHKLLKKIS